MSGGLLKLKSVGDPIIDDHPDPGNEPVEKPKKVTVVDLGNGSQVLHMPRFISYHDSCRFFDYLNENIHWIRPNIRVFAKSHVQPRDTCYVASEGLTQLVYSGYQPHAYTWNDFPPLKDILDLVLKAIPGSSFNSLLLNRYKGGNDYVGWHADDEKLYGPTPQIASISFGCERDFLLKKKPSKVVQDETARKNEALFDGAFNFMKIGITSVVFYCFPDEPARKNEGGPPSKRLKKVNRGEQHSFVLKHGSLLVMSGYTQRDWVHSVPKRVKAESVRINLTFRRIF